MSRTDRHVGTLSLSMEPTQADIDDGGPDERPQNFLRDNALGDQLSDMLRPLVTESFVPDETSPPMTAVVIPIAQAVRGGGGVPRRYGAQRRAVPMTVPPHPRRVTHRPSIFLMESPPSHAPCQRPGSHRAAPLAEACAPPRANGSIRSLGVAARGEDTDTDCAHCSAIFH